VFHETSVFVIRTLKGDVQTLLCTSIA